MSDIKTFCHGCVFSLGQNCFVGNYRKFEHNGAVVTVDDNTDSCVVDGKICVHFRDKNWVKQYPNEQAHFDDSQLLDKQKWLKIAQKELKLDYTAVIYVSDSIQEVETTYKSLLGQSTPPREIIYVKPLQSSVKPFYLRNFCLDTELPWRIETVLEDNADMGRCFDIGLDKVNSIYTIFGCAGFVLPEDFSSSMEQMFYINYESCILMKPPQDPVINTYEDLLDIESKVLASAWIFTQAQLANTLSGNRGEPLIDKIKKLAKEQSCQDLIKTYPS